MASKKPLVDKASSKTPVKDKAELSSVVRKRKLNRYRSFRLARKIPNPAGPLPTSWQIFRKARRMLWKNKKPLLFVLVLYILLNFALVRGFTTPLNVDAVKADISQSIGSKVSKTETTAAIFAQLIGANSSTADSSGLYQIILLVLFSLVLIWIFRQSSAGNKPKAKDAFYQGMYPIIPFLLVLLVMLLEVVPAILGSDLYSATVTSGVASSGYEKAVWIILTGLLVLLSAYLLFSSIFALYIVTLPGMTPMKALRSSRQLVFSRRLSLIRKLLFLIVIFILVLVLLVVPTIYFAAVIAPWLYFTLSIASVVVVHAYLFSIYKELL